MYDDRWEKITDPRLTEIRESLRDLENGKQSPDKRIDRTFAIHFKADIPLTAKNELQKRHKGKFVVHELSMRVEGLTLNRLKELHDNDHVESVTAGGPLIGATKSTQPSGRLR